MYTKIMEKFNEVDFRTSAERTVNEFYEGFSFPAKDLFDDSQMKHIINIVTSVFQTRHNFIQGGGFVQAVINNDLTGAYSRADSTMLKAMAIIVYAKEYGVVKKFFDDPYAHLADGNYIGGLTMP